MRIIGYQVCMILYLMGMAIICSTILRFANIQLNVVFFIMVMLLPLAIMGIGLSFQTKRRKLAAILPSIAGILFSILVLLIYVGSFDESCFTETVNALSLKHSQVIAYFTECPEVRQGRIVIRQERRIFPGVLLLKELYSEEFHEMGDIPHVEMTIMNVNTVRINPTKQRELTVEIQDFVYF